METSSNRVKHYRKAAGLTQKQLAVLAGTSQQQVQRIENGTIATSIEQASAISVALGQTLMRVFPKAGKALSKLSTATNVDDFSESELDDASDGGIELDPRSWTLKVLLRGHNKPICFPIDGVSHRRLRRALEGSNEDRIDFVAVDGGGWDGYLKVSEVSFAQLLYDPGFYATKGIRLDPATDAEELHQNVQVYFSGVSVPIGFHVGDDVPDEEGLGQIGNIGYHLGCYDPAQVHCLEDSDGEEVWLRAGDIAFFRYRSSIRAGEGEVDGEDDDGGA